MSSEHLTYLDNNATTQIDPAVIAEMMPFLTEHYGNASSAYRFAKTANDAVRKARSRLAKLLGCDESEVVFTSCGTESNNTAITSALQLDPDRQHIVTTRVEHSAITKHAEWLAKRGHDVTWIGVDAQGGIAVSEVERAIRPDTAIVSIMWANNETGVLAPIAEIAEICRKKKTLFHTDAVQAVGKIPINLRELPISFLSLSGHKLHAPKGVGALYVSRRVKFFPYLIGGSQEEGRRAGTEAVASIVALGKSAELAAEFMEHENVEVRALRDAFENGVLETISGVEVNGDRERRLPNTSNLAFSGIDAGALLLLLDKHNVCCSAGSACTTGSLTPSHVLRAMGFSTERARSSLRFSFGRFNTKLDVDHALRTLANAVGKLRKA